MLTPVLLSSHPEYVGAARTLYEESFPESERVPFEALIRSCTMDGRFYVFTEGKEVKATFFYFQAAYFLFLRR